MHVDQCLASHTFFLCWTTPGAVAHVDCRGYLGLYPPHMVRYNLCTPPFLYLYYFYMLATIVVTILVFILFMFFVIMVIVYFDYTLSIASLSLCLCISSQSADSKVHGVSGQHCVSVGLICCLPADTPYILGHVVDHGCDTPIESFVVHSLNI